MNIAKISPFRFLNTNKINNTKHNYKYQVFKDSISFSSDLTKERNYRQELNNYLKRSSVFDDIRNNPQKQSEVIVIMQDYNFNPEVAIEFFNIISKGKNRILQQYDKETISEAVIFARKNKIECIHPVDILMCIDYIKTLARKNPTSENDIFPKELSKEEIIEKYGNVENWEDIIMDMYSQIRRTGEYAIDYPEYYTGALNDLLEETDIFSHVPNVECEYAGSWIYREYKKPCYGKNKIYPNYTKTRVSLNVKGSAELIRKLDNFMAENPDTFIYKIPDDISGWMKREDPVTLYFDKEVTPETENKIAKITEPYKRGKINNSPKNSSHPWFTVEEQPSCEEIDKLLEKAKELDIDLYLILRRYSVFGYLSSTGLFNACSKVIQEYEEYLNIK